MRGSALLVFSQPTQGLEMKKKATKHGSLLFLVRYFPNQEWQGEPKQQQQTRQCVFLHPIHFNQI